MSRHAVQHFAKLVQLGQRGYLVSWPAVGVSKPIGDSIERLWGTIRAMFRARGLEVPV